MATAPSLQARAARIGRLRRWGHSSAEIEDARRDLAEAQLAAHIERIVADAPPLTADQQARLAVLLGGAR